MTVPSERNLERAHQPTRVAVGGERPSHGSAREEIAVELCSVTKTYGDTVAIHSVSLGIHTGEFFSLLGPSGCGKTTTLNLIGGFVGPDEGDIIIQGRSVVGIPAYRRPVNTVFQNYALFPHMSVADNISFGPRMARVQGPEIARRVKEIMALVSLSGLEHRRPSQLSGGQQQRVALARALVNHPAVLLLDEPLGALDLKLRKQMQLELGRIQREIGITFIYVTHDQEEAMTMSDRIAVMDRGRVVQVGTPMAIYERPVTRFVADFIGSSNVLVGQVVAREAEVLRVRLRSGAVVTAPISDFVPLDARVSVIVRPDRMRLCRGRPSDDVNVLSGRVTKISYLGPYFQTIVRMDDATELTVHQLSVGEQRNDCQPHVGDEIYVAWRVFHSLCFAEQ